MLPRRFPAALMLLVGLLCLFARCPVFADGSILNPTPDGNARLVSVYRIACRGRAKLFLGASNAY